MYIIYIYIHIYIYICIYISKFSLTDHSVAALSRRGDHQVVAVYGCILYIPISQIYIL